MRFLLKLTDRPRYELRRLTLEMAALCRAAASLDPALKSGLAGFACSTAAARKLLEPSGSVRLEFLDELETVRVRLEKAVLYIELHGLDTDGGLSETFLFLAESLRRQAVFLNRPGDPTPLAAAAGFTASALKTVRRAGEAARMAPGGFIPNLKFCTIYSDLEKAVCAVENCAGILARMT